MLGEILNPAAPAICPAPVERRLPKHLLYSIFARIGGSGLDTDAFEALRASYRGGFLGKAVAYDNRQTEITARRRNTSIGSRRAISKVGAMIFFTAGRAIVCKRCVSRKRRKSLRLSK